MTAVKVRVIVSWNSSQFSSQRSSSWNSSQLSSQNTSQFSSQRSSSWNYSQFSSQNTSQFSSQRSSSMKQYDCLHCDIWYHYCADIIVTGSYLEESILRGGIMHHPRGAKGQALSIGNAWGALVFSQEFSIWILILHTLLQVTTGSNSLFQFLQVTTGYYRLLQFTTGYYSLLQFTTG